MKLILAALVALTQLVYAQEAPAPAPKPVVLKSKAMTEADYRHFAQLHHAREAAIAAAELQKQQSLIPINLEQNALVEKVCKDLGVPKDKLPDCKPDIDPSKGKGFGEIRWEKPAEQPKPAAAKPATTN